MLVPILLLLPPSSLSLNSLCIDASEVPQLVVGHCGRRSQNDSRHSSLPPRLSFLPPSLPRPIILPSFFLATLSPPPVSPSLHSVGAVAPVVHCSGDGHYDSRYSVSCQVEVLSPGVLALKHLHQHDVELHPFQEHPGEGCQEEEMEQGREDCTGNLVWERKDGQDLFFF